MPWKPIDAHGKTHKAKSASSKKKWARIANAVLAKDHDEGKAVRIANAAVKRNVSRRKKR